MHTKRQRKTRQKIELEQLKSDANSFLALGFEDPILRKLETYRLYQAGYAAEDIGAAFGFARSYLYAMWERLKTDGVEALVDKRWGTASRKRTPEREAQLLRAKALKPERGDTELAQEFGLDRSTVYDLLKEHGLQDLHRVIEGVPPADSDNEPPSEGGKKGDQKSSRAKPPCGRMQVAYERLCAELNNLPTTLEHNGTSYRVLFSW